MKIWTVTTNDDSGSPSSSAHATEQEAVSAIWAWLLGYRDDYEDQVEFSAEDWREVFGQLSAATGFIDSITLQEHDVPPDEELAKQAFAAGYACGMDHDHDDGGFDEGWLESWEDERAAVLGLPPPPPAIFEVTVGLPGGIASTWRAQDDSGIIKEAVEDYGLRVSVDEHGFWVANWSSYEESFPTLMEAARAFVDAEREEAKRENAQRLAAAIGPGR